MKKIFIIACVFLILFESFVFYYKKQKIKTPTKKLTFWSIQLKPVYENEIKEIIKDYEEENPSYKVIWVDIPIQEAQKRTLASVLSSTPPDLINLNPEFSSLLAQRQILHYFEENEVEIFDKNLVDKLRYNNKIYGLPFYATSAVTIYNKKAFDKCLGKDVQFKTYDDIYFLSDKLYSCKNISPFVSNLNENDTLAKILNKYDISSLQDKKDIKTAIKIFSMLDDMYKKNYLPKDTLTINHREMIEKYMSENALSAVVGSNFIKMIKQNAPDVYAKSLLTNQLTGSNHKYDVSLMNFVIPEKAKNKDAAYDFAMILLNKENQLKLSKLTNVLPANKYALENKYFKNCPDDLVEQSRCIGVKQLSNLNNKSFSEKNKKAKSEAINKTLEEILLNNSNKDTIEKKIQTLSKELKILENN